MFLYEGLDDTFVMMNAWQRTDRSLDIPSRMGATMSEVSRVTATSLLVIRVTATMSGASIIMSEVKLVQGEAPMSEASIIMSD